MNVLDNLSPDFEQIYQENIDWELLNNSRILITGATGMIASYLVYFLCFLREEKNITVNILAQARNKEKAYLKFKEFWECDYFEFSMDNILLPITNMPSCDYIIHAASLASPRYYSTMPIEVAEPNAIGTYNLLEFATQNVCKCFLYFSSGDVYGKVNGIENITEEDMGCVNPLDLHSCYSESKRMGETWCKLFAHERKLRTVIARIGHTYGPTMDIENDPRVFASFMKALIQKEDIIMYSDGTAKRAFCYLSDAVVAFFLLLLKGEAGEAYNVCNTNVFISMNELAKIILELEKDSNIQLVYKNRDSNDAYIDNKDNKQNKPVFWKLEKLGWAPKISAEVGFARTFECMMKDRIY